MPYSCPGCDLTGQDFSGHDLTGADLRGSNLTNTNFTKATMSGADLTGATISGTDFTGVNLSTAVFGTPPHLVAKPGTRTVLKDATIPFSTLGLDWSDLDLRGAKIAGLPNDLSGLLAVRARLDGLNLSRKTLKRARFDDARLDGTLFFGATLTEASLTRATLVQTDLMQANLTGTVFDSCDVTQCRFSMPPLFSRIPESRTSFQRATINAATLGLNWSFLDLSDATIVGLEKVRDLSGLSAKNTMLTTLDLSDRVLTGAVFSGATLRGTNFRRARLEAAVLTGATCPGADFTSARMSNCDVNGADLSRATLDSAFFDGATLVGARLGSVSAKGTQFGGLTPAFEIAASQEAIVRLGDVHALAPLFRQAGYGLSSSATLNQVSGLWIVSDGERSYSVLLAPATSGEAAAQLTLYRPSTGHGSAAIELALNDIAVLNSGTADALKKLFADHGLQLSGPAVTRGLGVWIVDDRESGSQFTIRKEATPGGATITVFTRATAAVLDDAYMADADLTNANLYGVAGGGLQLYGSGRLDGAILESAQLSGANLGGMRLVGARLLGTVLTDATLVNANLRGATLTPAGGARTNLLRANLQGADFTDAMLYGADLTNAAIAIEIGSEGDAGVWLLRLEGTLAGELDSAERHTLATGAAACRKLQQALDAKDRPAVAKTMKQAGITLSATATITTDGHMDIWRIAADDLTTFTIFAGVDPEGLNEYFVRPAPPLAEFSLNPDGSSEAFDAIKTALDRSDLEVLDRFFDEQGQPLPSGAQLIADKIGSLWLIADTKPYVVWSGVARDLQPTIFARRMLPQTTNAFARAGITLLPQALVDKWSGDQWSIDNDSGNPHNLLTGYMKFVCLRSDAGIDVYGTEIHIERLGPRNRREIAVLRCEPTILGPENLSADTICPNGSRLDQQPPRTRWTDWIRGRKPPGPPICVPNEQSYCPVNIGVRERLARLAAQASAL